MFAHKTVSRINAGAGFRVLETVWLAALCRRVEYWAVAVLLSPLVQVLSYTGARGIFVTYSAVLHLCALTLGIRYTTGQALVGLLLGSHLGGSPVCVFRVVFCFPAGRSRFFVC